MSKLTPTPGQTVGPFYGYALPFNKDNELLAPGSPGSIRLQGTVYDGAGNTIPDAILEIWQPDSAGNIVQRTGSLVRDGYTFTGWGRGASWRWSTQICTAPCTLAGSWPRWKPRVCRPWS